MATGLFRFLCFFDLAISADYGFYIVTDEKPAFIIVSSRSGQRIFSFKQDDYEWINSKDKVEIHVAAVLKDGSRKPFRKFISYKDNDSFSGGIIDEMSYNIIDVLFQESLAELESEAFDKNFKGWVLRTLDNFIDLYKYIAHDAPIDKSLIYKAPIIQVLGSEKTIELNSSVGVEGEFKYIKNIINWDDPIKNGYIKSRCSRKCI